MMDAQLDLELLQALLLGTEIVNISVREVIRLAEKARMFVNDLLRQVVDCLNRPSDHTGIENMVIVLAVIEADQSILREFCNIIRTRVDESIDCGFVLVRLALELPVNQQQVREHLAVKEHDRCLISYYCSRLLGLEVHLGHDLQASIRLIRTGCSEAQDTVTHIVHVIGKVAVVGVLKNFVDEVDGRFSVGMDFLVEIAHDEDTQRFLALDTISANHFFSLHW